MADITMCFGTDCPLANKCYRHEAKASKWQSYFINVPYENGECKFFWKLVKSK